MQPILWVRFLGLVPFEAMETLQCAFAARRCRQELYDGIMGFETPPIITLGKNADASDVFNTKALRVFRCSRGGKVTGHEPGQLLMYPLLKLEDWALGVKSYVSILEGAVKDTLAEWDVCGSSNSLGPGVWVKGAKIASIGVRLERGVTMHGVAVNISNTLEVFESFVPCGLVGVKMTSLSKEIGQQITVASVFARLSFNFVQSLLSKR
jgi:lipoate-protein ligase B